MPAKNSRDAPPPVETCEILEATPAALIAFSESPPPTTETAPDSATALAKATVPLSNVGFDGPRSDIDRDLVGGDRPHRLVCRAGSDFGDDDVIDRQHQLIAKVAE